MSETSRYVRQPIVSVLGHVDHGKTTLLDFIRGSAVAARESGAITQHIGATEVPIEVIYSLCGVLLRGKRFTLPGLLFIDTPGHHAFTTLRSRGGSLADIAVLVVDINEGFKPQTFESVNILKRFRTPFVVAANKVDALTGWEKMDGVAKTRIEGQRSYVRELFDEKVYDLIGTLFENKLKADLFFKITDFRKTVGIVPVSAKTGEGVPELLMVLVGLAQRFLEKRLHIETGPGKGNVLEVKEEVGLGTTVDSILYSGSLRSDDKIVIGTKDEPLVTEIRALLKPKPLDEIRDPRNRFDSVKEVHAACGVKIVASNLEGVIPGAPVRVVSDDLEGVIEEVKKQSRLDFKTEEDGVVVKADTIGSLEAIINEAGDKGIKIRKAEIGNVSKRDVMEADTIKDVFNRVIFAFNVKILPEAQMELEGRDIKVFREDVIYTLMEKYEEWYEKKKAQVEAERRETYVHPAMIKFLPEYVFRVSKPAVIGVRVISGRIKSGVKLMNEEGKTIGAIQSIQSKNKTVKEATQGEEVAISIEGVTVGRQIKRGEVFFTDIPSSHARRLREMDVLNADEKDVLEKIYQIKRKKEKFWGM